MHAYFVVAIGQLFERDGVVEILGIFGVDGKGGYLAEVAAPGGFFGWYSGAESRGFRFHGFWKRQWETEIGQYSIHFGVVLAFFTQHEGNLTHRILALAWPFGDGYHYFLAVFGPVQIGQGYEDIVQHFAVVRVEERKAGGYGDGAGKLRTRTFQYFHHFAFLTLAASFFVRMYFYAVAMQCLAQLPWRDIYVVFQFVFGYNECRAVGGHVHFADNESFQ